MVFESVALQKLVHRIHDLPGGGETLDAFNELKRTAADISDSSLHLKAPVERQEPTSGPTKGKAGCKQEVRFPSGVRFAAKRVDGHGACALCPPCKPHDVICPTTGKLLRLIRTVSSPPGKNIVLPFFRNMWSLSPVPPPLEGRIAIVTDVGSGMRWT